jgi:hypothetical protein
MPNVSAVNLSFLKNDKLGSATALILLADLSKGPLRLQKRVENGVTVKYLGVRSWPTYFFEKLIATPAQKTKAKIEAQVAIEQHARSFLKNSGLTMAGRSADGIIATLHSRVIGGLVTKLPVEQEAARAQEGNTTTAPTFQDQDGLIRTKHKTFRGAAIVPTGLSIAAISPLKVIADIRLVTEATFNTPLGQNKLARCTVSQGAFTSDIQAGIDDYKVQYLNSLNCVAALVQTSVVLEVQPDANGKCSDANREGARQAATAFIQSRKLLRRHVSVMLTVPELPPVTQPAGAATEAIAIDPTVKKPGTDTSSTVKKIDIGSKVGPGDILLSEAEAEESENF